MAASRRGDPWITRPVETVRVMGSTLPKALRCDPPTELAELFHGRDEKRGKPPVDRFVHCQNRQWQIAGEGTAPVDATDPQVTWLCLVRHENERSRVNRVPHHGQFSSGIGDGLRVLCGIDHLLRQRTDRCPPWSHAIRRCGLADPKSNFERPGPSCALRRPRAPARKSASRRVRADRASAAQV